MLLNLKKNLSSNNTINKTFVDVLPVEIRLKNDFNILNPDFYLRNIVDLESYNYIELPELNKSYFIDSISLVSHNLYKLTCSVDVLQVYGSEILNCNASFKRGVRVGDYVNGDIESGVKTTVENIESNVTFENVTTNVLVSTGV